MTTSRSLSLRPCAFRLMRCTHEDNRGTYDLSYQLRKAVGLSLILRDKWKDLRTSGRDV